MIWCRKMASLCCADHFGAYEINSVWSAIEATLRNTEEPVPIHYRIPSALPRAQILLQATSFEDKLKSLHWQAFVTGRLLATCRHLFCDLPCPLIMLLGFEAGLTLVSYLFQRWLCFSLWGELSFKYMALWNQIHLLSWNFKGIVLVCSLKHWLSFTFWKLC